MAFGLRNCGKLWKKNRTASDLAEIWSRYLRDSSLHKSAQ